MNANQHEEIYLRSVESLLATNADDFWNMTNWLQIRWPI